jgi:shikimate kinase
MTGGQPKGKARAGEAAMVARQGAPDAFGAAARAAAPGAPSAAVAAAAAGAARSAAPPAHCPLVLVGMMGAGKSAVGRLLATRLGRPFLDSDDAIAAAAGAGSVRELFAREGEAAFRARERRFIAELSAYAGHVLALGGGMFAGAENVSAIRAVAFAVWLRARPETLLARLSASDRALRPLLDGDADPARLVARLAALLAERAPWYAQAHATIDTDGLATEDVAALVLALLAAPAPTPPAPAPPVPAPPVPAPPVPPGLPPCA